MLKSFKKWGAAVGASALLVASVSIAQAETLRMASLGQASPTTVFSVAVSQIIKREHGYTTQLAVGSPATRQIVEAANQQLELFTTAVSINGLLRDSKAMYKDLPNANELYGNIRGIVNYPVGAYHGIVWADSGIESMEDIKGKKVYAGPPSSAGRRVITQIIDGVTGYQIDTDFEPVNLDWASAEQAFQDRQIDVYFVPTPIPSAHMQQLSALGEFRVFGVPDAALETDGIKAAGSTPGRGFVFLEPGTYDGLVNEEPVRLISSMVGMGTHKWQSEEVVYNVTKSIMENNEELAQAAPWMASITPETALQQMNAPLHIGAYKYYTEIGLEIPEDLIPPEAN